MKNIQSEVIEQPAYFKKNLADYIFVLFIYLSIILPSGSIFGINVKILCLIAFMTLLLIYKNSIISSLFLKLLPIVIFLLLEITYSYIIYKYDSKWILYQAKDILVFFLVFYLCIIYANERFGFKRLLDSILNSVFVVGILKIIILFYSFISGNPVSLIIKSISQFFGVSIMSFDVEDTFVSRINFTSDTILFLCIFILAQEIIRKGVTWKRVLFLSIFTFSALLTMSRFQWASSIIAMILAVILNLNYKRALFFALSGTLLGMIALTLNSVQQMILTRFDSRIVSASDIERIVQEVELNSYISSAPFFGNGIGFYVPNLVRSDIAKYSYELQINALIMQFGWVGFLILILLILYPLINVANNTTLINMITYSMLIFIWIYGAMFNPILFSSSSGIVFVLIYVAIFLEKEKQHI